MRGVKVRDGESFEAAHRRFKRYIDKSGLTKELRDREFHQKGSVLKQKRIAAAKKRLFKKLLREKLLYGRGKDRRDRRG